MGKRHSMRCFDVFFSICLISSSSTLRCDLSVTVYCVYVFLFAYISLCLCANHVCLALASLVWCSTFGLFISYGTRATTTTTKIVLPDVTYIVHENCGL